MSTQSRLLSLLSDGGFHSGEEIGAQLSMSRSAVWKRIKSLQRNGLDIYSVKGKGYRIVKPLEMLDQAQLMAFIDADIVPFIRKLTLHTEIDSTNQFLLNRIGHHDFHGHITLAEFQSRGRGRRGNEWISPFAAGVYLSIAWYFDPAPEPLALISLGAGVAVLRALRRIGISDAGLKWPNDIIWNNRKLGGTLVEMRAESAGPCHVVTGIGVNYSYPTGSKTCSEIDQPWVDMATLQDPVVSRNKFTAILISEIIRLMINYGIQNDFDVIDEWRKYDCMKGKSAKLLLPDRTVYGQIQGVDDGGALLISVNNKLEKFSSGEISLRLQS
jgi:BirA family transcriptional regulator, biotin operon repressor / biotin---[acetyl-CoA-carboxylase] ligase